MPQMPAGSDERAVLERDERSVHGIIRLISAGAHVHAVLDAVVEGVRRVVGFDVVSLSLLNRDLELEPAAFAGPADVRREHAGRRIPLVEIEAELGVAEEWGGLLFVSGSGVGVEDGGDRREGRDAPPRPWHPRDTLRAPLRTPEGELLGMLAVDQPVDALRPDQRTCRTLETYADLAGVALSNARYADELEDRLRLAAAVEAIHTAASKESDVAAILEGSAEPVAMALAADALFVRAFDTEDGTDGDAGGHGVCWPAADPTPPDVIEIVSRNARSAWRNRSVETARVHAEGGTPPAQRRASVGASRVSAAEAPLEGVPHRPVAGGGAGWVRATQPVMPQSSGDEERRLLDFVDPTGEHVVLLSPIGAGADCLGYLVAVRGKAEEWTPYEVEAASQAARHLGQAVLNARVLQRERSVVDQLDALDRYTGELITTVSHELRTPLTSIKGHLEIIQDDPVGAPAESYDVIERNLERMQGLINDLLTLHKLSDDSPLDRSSVVDLAQVTRDAVASLRLRAERKGLSLALSAPPGPLLIGGDRDELERVALNLIVNAITYTSSGGSVRVECQRSDRFVRLIVSDTGIGISKPDQEELFTDFYRTNNPEALTMPGTGLGLSIVRRIVQRHTGSIRLESDTGQGSVFTVRLPVSHV